MAKANFVKKARKDYPEHDIKKGDSYYWWQLFKRAKQYSKTPPRRSQLTGSSFLSQLYDIEDNISDMKVENFSDGDEIKSEIDNYVGEIESLRDECQDSLDNMPDGLRESSESGQLLQERIDGLESWQSELENIDTDIDSDLNDEQKQERIQEILDEVQGTSAGL